MLIVINVPVNKSLQISSAKSGEIVGSIPVSEREEFTITFIHSVNKRPVIDYYRVEGMQLVVFKSRYDSFGAGMPETSIDGMVLKQETNGMLELANINRKLDVVTIFIGTVAQHSIQIKQQDIPLEKFGQQGEPLEFQIKNVSYLELWRGGVANER